VQFVAACKKPPVLCVVTEYLPGGSLRAFLGRRRGEPPPLHDAVRMALDVASAMEYLHLKGLVHRDLKSENLVLDADNNVCVIDFGVSRFESEHSRPLRGTDGDDPGTYRWMAPEMLRLQPCSRKVDVYSFGIVLWELLTALLPYEDLTPIQAAFLVSNKVNEKKKILSKSLIAPGRQASMNIRRCFVFEQVKAVAIANRPLWPFKAYLVFRGHWGVLCVWSFEAIGMFSVAGLLRPLGCLCVWPFEVIGLSGLLRSLGCLAF
jgi:serine/threonine protein kinase